MIGILDPAQKVAPEELGGDRRKVVIYKGHRIAIATGGDNRSELEKNVEFCKENGCDLFITATRTRGGSSETVNKFSQEVSCKITWLRKNEAIKLKDLINESQAKDIQAIIDYLQYIYHSIN